MQKDTGGSEARAAFAGWLAADPRHGLAYDAIVDAWDSLGGARGEEAAEAEVDTPPVHVLDAARRDKERGRILRRGLIGAGIAASLAGALIGTRLMLRSKPAVELSTGAGQRLRQTLADGSTLDLDANSSVRVALDGNRRTIDLLHGRVLFDVAHDARRPFVVATANGTVTVLGTMFSVEYRDAETSVTLFRGHVRAATRHGAQAAADLLPGDAARISGAGGIDLSHHVDLERALLWRRGRLVFEDETLTRVVSRMNDYGGDRIVVSDPAAAELHISGIFQAGRNDAFLNALKSYYGLAVARRDHAIVITSANARS